MAQDPVRLPERKNGNVDRPANIPKENGNDDVDTPEDDELTEDEGNDDLNEEDDEDDEEEKEEE